MIRVEIVRDAAGNPESISSQGHDSGDGDVCVAVSTLVQAAWLGIERVANISVYASKDNGNIEITWPAKSRDNPDLGVVVDTLEVAIRQLASDHLGRVELGGGGAQ